LFNNWQGVQIELLDLGAGPGGLAEELEAGLDAGIEVEAVDADVLAETFPAVVGLELGDHFFERDAMERVLGAGGVHAEG
jgi:hypothetical protein